MKTPGLSSLTTTSTARATDRNISLGTWLSGTCPVEWRPAHWNRPQPHLPSRFKFTEGYHLYFHAKKQCAWCSGIK